MLKKDDSNQKLYMIYIKAVSRGIIISIVLLLLTSLIFYFTSLNHDIIGTVVIIIAVISICYAGIYAAVKRGQKGYLHGACTGAIYMIILFLIAYLADRGQVSIKSSCIMFAMSVVVGALSGMIGMVLGNKNS